MDDFKAKKIIRNYHLSDGKMLMRAETVLKHLKKEHSLFIEKFPWLDDGYITGIENDIEAARKCSSDYTVNIEKKVTAGKKPFMEEAKKSLKILFKFAIITYPENKKKQKIFGQSRMGKARNNFPEMVNLLEYAYSIANKNPVKNDLLSRGYEQNEIDELQIIADKLSDKNIDHDAAKIERPVSTVERTGLLNAAFHHIWIMNKCAQVVFMKDPARIKLYKIYL
ncbi:MAG: hypothetical protein ABI855_15130 [Bacteroidota bacterium]